MFRFLSQLSISSFTLQLAVTTANRLIVVIRNLVFADTGCKMAVEALLDCISKLEQYFNRVKASNFTQKILESDTLRDDAFKTFYDILTGIARRKKDPEASEAATQILAVIDNYGATLYAEGYARESFLLNSLIKDLELPEMVSAIEKSKTGEYYQDVKTTQADFENVYNDKVKSLANENIPKISELKKDLVYYLNALLTIIDLNANFKVEQFPEIGSQLNEIINDSMKLYRAEQTRKETKDENDNGENTNVEKNDQIEVGKKQ